VRWICEEIAEQDALAKLRRKWSTFNLAFLDPYGLELQWETVEHLAQMNKMDLIINFSTSGLNRYIDQAVNSREATKIDSFFGTDEWRDLYDPSATATVKRRIWIDFYINRLAKYGYVRFLPDLGDSGEVSVKNRRNVQIYSLVFASKHPLGGKLWNVAAKDDQPRLPGF
jgi:three-Cys-motif partner protein